MQLNHRNGRVNRLGVNPNLDITFSEHAIVRSEQRNLSYDEILFVVQYANRIHRAGGLFCQLRNKDMPDNIPGNHPYRRLVGTTVLLCPYCAQQVITAYRNKKAFLRDRQKSKTCSKRNQRCSCGHFELSISKY